VITMNCRNFDPHRVVKYRDLNFPNLIDKQKPTLYLYIFDHDSY
jgi:hypothetical protein